MTPFHTSKSYCLVAIGTNFDISVVGCSSSNQQKNVHVQGKKNWLCGQKLSPDAQILLLFGLSTQENWTLVSEIADCQFMLVALGRN